MTEIAWEMTQSVEVDAGVEFAWQYWADVRNWDDPPATFALEGEFAEGARGVTRIPGQPEIAWFVRDLTPNVAATIEIPADGAVLVFAWRFEGVGDRRTRITQRVILRGEKAAAYLEFARTMETTLPQGMRRLAGAMEAARGAAAAGA